MKYWACLLAVMFLAACGGEEEPCAGEPGSYTGTFEVVQDGCGDRLSFLDLADSEAKLELREVGDERFLECGEHLFDDWVDFAFVNGDLCGVYVTRWLYTYNDHYVGVIEINLDCPDKVCVFKVEAEFR